MDLATLLLPLLPLLLLSLPSSANLHKNKEFFRTELLYDHNPRSLNLSHVPPTTYFEVTKPIKLPHTKPCSYLVLRQDFGSTYGRPPILVDYTPPTNCPSQRFAKIVLEWKATCKGRQFDRIFGVWLGGAELLRSCTAEPRATGIVWTVKKDITRYYSLLFKNQTLAVYLGNLIDKTYTGVYHANLTFHFYPAEEHFEDIDSDTNYGPDWGNLVPGPGSPADMIIPISRNLPLNSGLWFEIENSTDFGAKQFKIPQNAYRAVLEVYVSFHENDEFWYGNPPNDYIVANNLTDTPGNGPFREVVVSLDGLVVGAVWPFTVVYTGGINPLLWRPITGTGSFDLPSYDIEITPFLGNLLDGNPHRFKFAVTNALNAWYIDANLHVWLDRKGEKTEGKLLGNISLPLLESLISNFQGLDGSFLTSAGRNISAIGWVKSSHGNVTTQNIQEFSFINGMEFGNNGRLQIVNQTIHFNESVYADKPSSSSNYTFKSFRRFPFHLYSNVVDQGNKSNRNAVCVDNVLLGFDEERTKGSGSRISVSSLKNSQSGEGYMVVNGSLVTSGLGSTREFYNYESPGFCYFRNVSSWNYTILYDDVWNKCGGTRGFDFSPKIF